MARLSLGVVRLMLVVLVGAGLVLGPRSVASAQTPTPTPTEIPTPSPTPTETPDPDNYVAPTLVLKRAPHKVRFRGTARIKGKLRSGSPSDRVRLERKRPGGRWRTVDKKRAGRDLKVRFRVRRLKRTSKFRLEWRGSSASRPVRSAKARVGVRPKLVLRASPKNVMRGQRVRIWGRIRPRVGGRRVIVSKRVNGRWRRAARPRVGDGRFRLRIEGRSAGSVRLRVKFRGDRHNLRRRRSARIRVFRPSEATWYGPGFYGNLTACGQTLTGGTLGVANRTLPCGTQVTIFYGGRTITVPVIDRGPYNSADWDLTSQTADRLGFSGRGHVGVLR